MASLETGSLHSSFGHIQAISNGQRGYSDQLDRCREEYLTTKQLLRNRPFSLFLPLSLDTTPYRKCHRGTDDSCETANRYEKKTISSLDVLLPTSRSSNQDYLRLVFNHSASYSSAQQTAHSSPRPSLAEVRLVKQLHQFIVLIQRQQRDRRWRIAG